MTYDPSDGPLPSGEAPSTTDSPPGYQPYVPGPDPLGTASQYSAHGQQYVQQPGQPPPPPYPGYPPGYPYYPGPMPPETSGWAIASLVCSIAGFVGFVFVGWLLGVVFGHLALHEINRSGGRIVGRGMAVSGLVIGYVMLALCIVFVVVVIVAIATIGPSLQPLPMPATPGVQGM